MSQYFSDLGRKLKIPDLTCTNLRKLLETRNLQGSSNEDVAPAFRVGEIAAATHQIGHTTATANKYYKSIDQEELTLAVNRLLFLLEEAGHKEWVEEEEEGEDEENDGGDNDENQGTNDGENPGSKEKNDSEDDPDGADAVGGKENEHDDNWMSQVGL